MTQGRSVEETVASLQAEMVMHREKGADHARHEAFHRERKIHHENQLQVVARRLDELCATSIAAAQLLGRYRPPYEEQEPQFGPASRPQLARMAMQILRERDPEESFGALWLTSEINRWFGHRLRRRITHRQTSDALRRLAGKGYVRLVRPGHGSREARYVRESPRLPESPDAHHTE